MVDGLQSSSKEGRVGTSVAPSEASPPEAHAETDGLTPRERRAIHVAAEQGLVLRRSSVRCGGEDRCRYNLVYKRYEQPVAVQVKLASVEAWLGIGGTGRR